MAGLEDTRLGAYHLIERIGSGGMAQIYRARQLRAFGRDVALRVIRPEFTQDETFRTRFVREAYAISRLSHPNILPLIELGDEHSLLYLVMPWVHEGSLRDLIKRYNGPLPLEVVIPLFIQLCNAVQYAHEEGVLHRAIKPQNVLLQRGTHVLLTDFGIARDLAQIQVTATGVGSGSVEYMAPEQARGQADSRSDIYSLGVVLFQLLTGTVPFSGIAPLQGQLKHSAEPLPDLHHLNPSLPPGAIQIIEKALAKDPQQRFASAQALGHMLQEIRPDVAPDTLATHLLPPSISDLPTRQSPDIPTTPLGSQQPPFDDWPTAPGQHLGMAANEPPPSEPPFGIPQPPQAGGIRSPGEPQEPAGGRIVPPEDTWGGQNSYGIPGAGNDAPPPGAGGPPPNRPAGPYNQQPPPPRGRGPLIIALLAALLLVIALSSITYGYFGLGWLHPGSASHGSHQVTNTPTATNTPTPSATPFPAPTSSQQPTAAPTDTPGGTPNDTPTAGPTDTPTGGPTDTPTPGAPAATPTPSAPTDTPTPGLPTATPTPGAPTDTPTP